jgi:mannosyltransferase OCH1-like enzyme
MWNFKSSERKAINPDVILHNSKYIKGNTIITPVELDELITTEVFSELPELYHIIPHWIVKCDLGRLLLVYFYSGIYSDVDCFIKKSFHNDNVILFTEHICTSVDQLGERECKDPENLLRVANYFFGSKTKRHPFFKEVIEECLRRLKTLLILENKQELNHADVLWVCGPDVVTTIFHKSKHKYDDITLHDDTFLRHECNSSWR